MISPNTTAYVYEVGSRELAATESTCEPFRVTWNASTLWGDLNDSICKHFGSAGNTFAVGEELGGRADATVREILDSCFSEFVVIWTFVPSSATLLTELNSSLSKRETAYVSLGTAIKAVDVAFVNAIRFANGVPSHVSGDVLHATLRRSYLARDAAFKELKSMMDAATEATEAYHTACARGGRGSILSPGGGM